MAAQIAASIFAASLLTSQPWKAGMLIAWMSAVISMVLISFLAVRDTVPIASEESVLAEAIAIQLAALTVLAVGTDT